MNGSKLVERYAKYLFKSLESNKYPGNQAFLNVMNIRIKYEELSDFDYEEFAEERRNQAADAGGDKDTKKIAPNKVVQSDNELL